MFKCLQVKRVSSVATIWTKRQVSFLLHPTFLNLINTSSQKCDASNLLTTPNVNKNKHFHRCSVTGFQKYFHFLIVNSRKSHLLTNKTITFNEKLLKDIAG